MAVTTSRPFAYNPTAIPIPGTTQSGQLTIGTPTYGFPATGLAWWNGPLETGAWIIAKPVPSNTQPTPIPGVFASVGFLRSSGTAPGSFATLVNQKFSQSFQIDAGGDTLAKAWLDGQGLWTNHP
jgi:hypothetical protein